MLKIVKQTKDSIDITLIKNIIQSFNNYHLQNDYPEEISIKDIDSLWTLLGTEELYVVFRNYKLIGFFSHKLHYKNKEISFNIFLSPLACPKSNVSMIKCAVVNSMILFKTHPKEFIHLEFITSHPILASSVKSFIPTINITMITPTRIICYKEIDQNDLNYFKAFTKTYIELETPENYNSYELLR